MQKWESRSGSFLCSECGKGFDYQAGLSQHMKVVHAPKVMMPCPHCPLTDGKAQLYSKYSLYSHINAQHKKNHMCPRCTTSIPSSSMLVVHYRITHMKYKQFRCSHCMIKFAKKCYAFKHIQQKHMDTAVEDPSKEELTSHPYFEDLRYTEPESWATTKEIRELIKVDSNKLAISKEKDQTDVNVTKES